MSTTPPKFALDQERSLRSLQRPVGNHWFKGFKRFILFYHDPSRIPITLRVWKPLSNK